jgi:hypothetical protein
LGHIIEKENISRFLPQNEDQSNKLGFLGNRFFDSKWKYKYDSFGKIKIEYYYQLHIDSFNPIVKKEYIYDEHNILIGVSSKTLNPMASCDYSYEEKFYYSDTILIRKTTKKKCASYTEIQSFIYNSKNQLVYLEKEFQNPSIPKKTYKYEYDKNGHKVNFCEINSDTETIISCSYYEYDNNQNLIFKKVENSEYSDWLYEYKYNKWGQISEEIWLDEDQNIQAKYIYKYKIK